MKKLTPDDTEATRRKGDTTDRVRFRSDRIFKDDDKWYFQTREGTLEGPFVERTDAENRLELYVKVMQSGWMPTDSELEMVPMDTKGTEGE